MMNISTSNYDMYNIGLGGERVNNDFVRQIMKTALENHFMDIKVQKEFQDLFTGTNERRRYLEHHPNIRTNVTDVDMLLLQIDMALDKGDIELFMQLTNELKGEKYAHCT